MQPGGHVPDPLRRAARNGRPAALVLVAAAAGLFLLVRLADVLLLLFASVLLALLLLALAKPLQQKARLSRPVALSVVIVLLFAASGLASWLLGAQMAEQLSSLGLLLPKSLHTLQAELGSSEAGRFVLGHLRSAKWPDSVLIGWATRFVGNTAAVLAGAVIVFAGASYLAFHPETYGAGLLRLVPPRHRGRAAEVLEACRRALTQWLVGQVVSMVFVGVTSSLGLWAVGVPAPLALGVLSGLGQAVPVVGPWAAAAPGLLVALAQSPQTFGLALALYLVITQFECNLLTPLVLRQTASVPMVVTLFAVVAMGMLLGPLGVLLATPLAVLAYELVLTVYLEDILGERASDAAASAPSGWRGGRGRRSGVRAGGARATG